MNIHRALLRTEFPIKFATSCFCFLLIGMMAGTLSAQKITGDNFNQKYLEHLVKTKIDSVRQSQGLTLLVNDSILYVASLHHSNFMGSTQTLSHFEEGKAETYSPQLRAEFYGAKNYSVGENVLKTTANSVITTKDGKKISTSSYEGLANSIVNGWVNSPGHYKNIITPGYQVTGVSVILKNNTVYACQKFATVLYKYSFDEPAGFFTYSAYQKPVLPTGFSGISRELIANYKYNWDLSHSHPERCDSCNEAVKNTPLFTVRLEGDKYILRVENSAYISRLIRDKYDGFAVEIVFFDDYMCGNPAYYTKPSRRNGQTKLNGIILEPVYRDELMKGYKMRKKNPDVKFLRYLFKRNGTKFVNRVSDYKIEQYTSEYFEIPLGRLPKNISGYWNHNLVYIQEKEICHVDYLTNYCGEVFRDSVIAEIIPPDTSGNYDFEVATKKLSFVMPFGQGQASFSEADIKPFTSSLNDYSYHIDSIHIRASSSVEGDSAANHALQIQRAQTIVEVLKKSQAGHIPVSITTSTAWTEFRTGIKKFPKLAYLANKSTGEISSALTTEVVAQIEPLLSQHRKAEVDLYCRLNFDDKNLVYYLDNEQRIIEAEIGKTNAQKADPMPLLIKFENLYRYAHKKVVQGVLSPDYFAGMRVPGNYQLRPELTENFVLYGYLYPEAFKNNTTWTANHSSDLNTLITKHRDNVSDLLLYNWCLFKSEELATKPAVTQAEIQEVLNVLAWLEGFYMNSVQARINIERVSFNLNMMLMNDVFQSDPVAFTKDSKTSLDQVYKYYSVHDTLTAERIVKIAKAHVFFSNTPVAVELLNEFEHYDEVSAYLLPLMYDHVSSEFAEEFYQVLLQKSTVMNESIWCNMFLSHCGIPFQVFDHEELRNTFCEKCMEENDYINQKLNP